MCGDIHADRVREVHGCGQIVVVVLLLLVAERFGREVQRCGQTHAER